MIHVCNAANAFNPKSHRHTLFKYSLSLSLQIVFQKGEKQASKKVGPYLLRNMKFIHHFELIIHLYPTFHQLQFCQGQVTEVEFVNFIFLCIWKLFLLWKDRSQIIKANGVFLGLSMSPPSPVLGPGQSRKGYSLQRPSPHIHTHTPHMLWRAPCAHSVSGPVLTRISASSSSSHSHGSFPYTSLVFCTK